MRGVVGFRHGVGGMIGTARVHGVWGCRKERCLWDGWRGRDLSSSEVDY